MIYHNVFIKIITQSEPFIVHVQVACNVLFEKFVSDYDFQSINSALMKYQNKII